MGDRLEENVTRKKLKSSFGRSVIGLRGGGGKKKGGKVRWNRTSRLI